MRTLLLALLLTTALAHAQVLDPVPDSLVQSRCGAPQVTVGQAVSEVATIFRKLSPDPAHIRFAVTHSFEVNAWEYDLSAGSALICVPLGLVRVLGSSEGQLAFMIGHEIGHATDTRCQSNDERAKLSSKGKSGAVSALLFGQSNGREAADQRTCETRADNIGFDLLTRAGYDPHDAEAAFQTLLPYFGSQSSGPLAKLANLGRDHPLTHDRIRRLHKRAEQQSKQKVGDSKSPTNP